MSYDIERASFDNLLVEEGWDGIHIRGGKDIRIRNCRFYTGDDAVAGGLWKNMVIENCYMNSSCNGIRLIMPATGLKIVDCEFRGPGNIHIGLPVSKNVGICFPGYCSNRAHGFLRLGK